jgi:hypothetical protein
MTAMRRRSLAGLLLLFLDQFGDVLEPGHALLLALPRHLTGNPLPPLRGPLDTIQVKVK